MNFSGGTVGVSNNNKIIFTGSKRNGLYELSLINSATLTDSRTKREMRRKSKNQNRSDISIDVENNKLSDIAHEKVIIK